MRHILWVCLCSLEHSSTLPSRTIVLINLMSGPTKRSQNVVGAFAVPGRGQGSGLPKLPSGGTMSGRICGATPGEACLGHSRGYVRLPARSLQCPNIPGAEPGRHVIRRQPTPSCRLLLNHDSTKWQRHQRKKKKKEKKRYSYCVSTGGETRDRKSQPRLLGCFHRPPARAGDETRRG